MFVPWNPSSCEMVPVGQALPSKAVLPSLPPMAGGWDCVILKVPSNHHHSVIFFLKSTTTGVWGMLCVDSDPNVAFRRKELNCFKNIYILFLYFCFWCRINLHGLKWKCWKEYVRGLLPWLCHLSKLLLVSCLNLQACLYLLWEWIGLQEL